MPNPEGIGEGARWGPRRCVNEPVSRGKEEENSILRSRKQKRCSEQILRLEGDKQKWDDGRIFQAIRTDFDPDPVGIGKLLWKGVA